MKVYVNFEKQIKEVELEGNTYGDLRKKCVELFSMSAAEFVLRSGTRPVRDEAIVKEGCSINMAKPKPVPPPKEIEPSGEYTYEYEEVYESSDYEDKSGEDGSDEDFSGDEGKEE